MSKFLKFIIFLFALTSSMIVSQIQIAFASLPPTKMAPKSTQGQKGFFYFVGIRTVKGEIITRDDLNSDFLKLIEKDRELFCPVITKTKEILCSEIADTFIQRNKNNFRRPF